MDAHIPKPIRIPQLIETIQMVMGSPEPDGIRADAAEHNGAISFNREDLLTRTAGDEELIQLIVEAFMDDAPRKISELRSAADGRDSGQIKFHAHTLKGAAGNVAATNLQQLSHQLETAGERQELDNVQMLMGKVEAEFEVLKEILAKLKTS